MGFSLLLFFLSSSSFSNLFLSSSSLTSSFAFSASISLLDFFFFFTTLFRRGFRSALRRRSFGDVVRARRVIAPSLCRRLVFSRFLIFFKASAIGSIRFCLVAPPTGFRSIFFFSTLTIESASSFNISSGVNLPAAAFRLRARLLGLYKIRLRRFFRSSGVLIGDDSALSVVTGEVSEAEDFSLFVSLPSLGRFTP